MPEYAENMTLSEPQGFVATVRPQHEATVGKWLTEAGIEPFSPVYRVRKQWSDRKKELQQPVFPGYIFCRFDWNKRVAVLKAPGIRWLISFGGVSAPVPDQEVERIRLMAASGNGFEPWPYLAKGNAVRIEHGPLRSMEGIVVETDGDFRLVVGVTLLQRSVSVIIDRNEMVPLPNPVKGRTTTLVTVAA